MADNHQLVAAKPMAPYDIVEQCALLVFFLFFAVRMLTSFFERGAYIDLLFFLNEAVLLGFVLFRRRARAISQRPEDWIIGFGGTCLPLLLLPASGEPLVPVAGCAALMLLGFSLHFSAKLTLRWSFGVVAANRGVKVSGPYLFIRHPMYAGYMIAQLSLVLAGPNLTNLLILSVAWSLQVARIFAEEHVLQQDQQYRDLMVRTRYRLIPGVF